MKTNNELLAKIICFGGAIGLSALGVYILLQNDLTKCTSTKHSGVICDDYSGTGLILWGVAVILFSGVPLGLYYLEKNKRVSKILLGLGLFAIIPLIAAPFFK